MPTPVLFHVGYHKTATTWMQRKLFSSAHGYEQIADHVEVFEHVIRPHGLLFDTDGMRDLIRKRRAQVPAGTVPVISSENLTGNPFHGGRDSDIYAERLKRIEPDAKILLSIRPQLSILPSVYMQYLLRGGTMSPKLFFDGTDRPGYFGFAAEHFEYDRLISSYQVLFGRENVLVVSQEVLKKDLDKAARQIADFSGNDVFSALRPEALEVHAASYPEYAAPVLRRINHVRQSTINPSPIVSLGGPNDITYRAAGYLLRRPLFSGWLRSRKPISDLVRKEFATRFDESNRRLKTICSSGTDLTGF